MVKLVMKSIVQAQLQTAVSHGLIVIDCKTNVLQSITALAGLASYLFSNKKATKTRNENLALIFSQIV